MTIDPRIPLMVQPVRSELDRQQSLADLAMRQQTTDLQRQQFEMGQEDRQEAQQARMTAQQRQQAEQIARLTTGVTDEATYQQRLAAARAYGIDVSQAPANYEPEWVQTQNTISQVLLRPDGQRELTNAAKELQDAGLQPGTPEFQAAMMRRITLQDSRVITTPAGGAAGLYGPQGYEQVIAPNPGGYRAGAPVGAAPVTQTIDGVTLYQNPQTGRWFDNAQEAMGGSGGNTAGTFQP